MEESGGQLGGKSRLTEEGRKLIAPEFLPNSHLLSWQVNKLCLGRLGKFAAAFDSKTDDTKMAFAFACSIYVKLTAVVERKVSQHCDEHREARRIKAPCQLVRHFGTAGREQVRSSYLNNQLLVNPASS